MAKVAIKSEKLSPFGGIFSIMEQFDSNLSSVIDSTLGMRCRLYGYQYITIWKQILKKKIMSRYNHRIFPVFFFSKTVICYLLSVPQKFVFGNCQLSTVTLGIDIGFALIMSKMYVFCLNTMVGKMIIL